MCAPPETRGRDRFRCIGGTAAEIVLPVRWNTEIGGIHILPDLEARFQSVWSGGVADVLLLLEQIAVSLHHRSSGAVEGFEETVFKLHCGVRGIGGRKARGGSGDRKRGLEHKLWRERRRE